MDCILHLAPEQDQRFLPAKSVSTCNSFADVLFDVVVFSMDNQYVYRERQKHVNRIERKSVCRTETSLAPRASNTNVS